MYRRFICVLGCRRAYQHRSADMAILAASCCQLSTLSGDNETGNENSAARRTRRAVRRVVPSDEEMADLHETECEAMEEVAASSKRSLLASVMVEPMRFSPQDAGPTSDRGGDGLGDLEDDPGEDACLPPNDSLEAEEGAPPSGGGDLLRASGGDVGASSVSRLADKLSPKQSVDPLLSGGSPEGSTGPSTDTLSHAIFERQTHARSLTTSELVDVMVLYLRATVNPRLVSAEDEHVLFPVVQERLSEFHVEQLLDIVECHWARSTLVRYGTEFKDMVRDRIALIASAAAKGLSQTRPQDRAGNGASNVDKATDVDNVDDDCEGPTSAVYTHEVDRKEGMDAIILHAVEEMSASTVLRCIVVMGMSAGRRKRDLQFFQALGVFLVHHINHYKDPHDLVRVLTAFARAKIVPSRRFLALLGRRFAVLNKRKPLGALPSYRALVNFFKMGHDQMNSFRFLADCIFATIDANVKAEKKHQRLVELQRERGSSASSPHATGAVSSPDGSCSEVTDASLTPTKAESCNDKGHKGALTSAQLPNGAVPLLGGDLDPQLVSNLRARERFKRITELKPSMFTKLLLVLARFGAPHQQYLRPTTVPLILPTLRAFPPPSFSRLLRAMCLFKTSDLDLIEPIIDFIADDLGAAVALPTDVLRVVRLISPPDVPVPRNLTKLVALCETVYSSAGPESASLSSLSVNCIRPGDMCALAVVLLKVQMKEDIPLDALDPLTRLMELFAKRMLTLMKLGIVSLTHIDIFTDLCRQQQHPDASGSIAQLCAERRRVNDLDGDEEYYSRIDIDVRETFHKIMIVNDFNTYGQYRPTPGVLQVDFKQALTEVSAFDVLEAAHLFALAFPNAMKPTVERHLSRSIIAKLSGGGEEVITPENTVVLRPPRELLLTRADLTKFVELLQQTPLRRVRESAVVWKFIEEKATRLKMNDVIQKAQKHTDEVASTPQI
uniref:Mitochondrial RNA binding complex 1 subunit n=1 Tax=Trypanosoma vivax (strain Y486) TaxID=1055687 RepID=G0TZX3_TRYVY|nr:conserved hypothetical protein [Trypanosoma vivax Y486]